MSEQTNCRCSPKKKVGQLTKSIRKKFQNLKLGSTEEDDALNKLFIPVTAPLKQIATHQLAKPKSLKVEK